MERYELWERLVRNDYFDWCRLAELRKLERLFMSGDVGENPAEFLLFRELFWHPDHTVNNWRNIQKKRTCIMSADGVSEPCDELAEKWVARNIDHLWQFDWQFVGLTIEKQLEMSGFLGLENFKPNREEVFVERWLEHIMAWISAKPRDKRDASLFMDSKFARSKEFFYQLVEGAPLIYKDKKAQMVTDKLGWHRDSAFYFVNLVKDLIKLVVKYKIPKQLQCDPGPRLAFVESFRKDLEAGNAPPLIVQIWASLQKK